jgi:hypothetical protein
MWNACLFRTAQRAVNHLTRSGDRRIRINLPEVLDIDNLLSCLKRYRGSFDIRARQASESLYILDLHQCYRYLSTIRRQQVDSRQDLRKFIDRDILKVGAWQDCINDCKPLDNLMVSGCPLYTLIKS